MRLMARTSSMTVRVIQITSCVRMLAKKLLSRCAESITASSNGVDERFLVAALELGSEAIDVNLDDVGGAFPVGFPQAFAQHFACHDLAGMAHEEFENAEFRGGEF